MKNRKFIFLIAISLLSLNLSVGYAATVTVETGVSVQIDGTTLSLDNLNINSGGRFSAGTGTINVNGDFENRGVFNPGQGTVRLFGPENQLIGNITFYELIKIAANGGVITFENGSTITIEKKLVLRGAFENLLDLESDVDGRQYKIVLKPNVEQVLSFLGIKDLNASGGITLLALNSEDLGNNSGARISPTGSIADADRGAIIGIVVDDSSGDPIAGIFVVAVDTTDRSLVESSTTKTDGTYEIKITNGDYKVFANAFGSDFESQFYNTVSSFTEAKTVTVLVNQNLEGIDFALSSGKKVEGGVTDPLGDPVEGMFVDLFDASNDDWIEGGITDNLGEYSITVSPGKYDIELETLGTIYKEAILSNVEVTSTSDSVGNDFQLAFADSIKGNVAEKGGDQESLPDMIVILTDLATNEVINFDITDDDGNYSMFALPGSYQVDVDTGGTNYKSAAISNILVSGSGDITGQDFALSQKSSISGQVVDGSNNPQNGLFVDAFEFNSGFWISGAETDANGDYLIPVLPGKYKVGVDTFSTDFAPVFYDDVDWDTANQVFIVKDEEKTGIDFQLFTAGMIKGTITDGTNPIQNIIVDVFDADTENWEGFGETDAQGLYSATVRPGNYKVEALGFEQGFADEFFDDQTDFASASTINVLTQGQVIDNVNFVLTRGGSISGTILDGGLGVGSITVNANIFDGNVFINDAMTDGNGDYTIVDLPAGKYRLRAFDTNGNYPGKFYDGSGGDVSWHKAIAVTTLNGLDQPNIDFTFTKGGSISGNINDGSSTLGNIFVEAYSADTAKWINDDDSDGSGNYSIPLLMGDYVLRSFDPAGTYTAKYYNNAASWNDAGSVTVTNSNDTSGINFVLSEGKFISGLVRDDKNKLLSGTEINVFDFDTDNWLDSALTDKSGKYKISLPPGKYRVGAIPLNPTFTSTFYKNALSWDEASPVTITSTRSANDINFKLAKGGIIAGVVKDGSSNNLSEVNVQVFNSRGSWISDDITNTQGEFKITVPAGNYHIRAVSLDTSTNFSSEFYDNKTSLDFATNITVTNGNTETLNDIVLTSGHSITGSVSDDKSNLLSRIKVDVYDFDTGAWVNAAVSNKDGAYSVKGVPDSAYRLQALPQTGTLTSQFYKNVIDWDSAERVTVSGLDVGNIDFALLTGGAIKGKITDSSDGAAISGIEIDAFEFSDGVWINGDVTDGDGSYSINVPAGTYFVSSAADGTDYVDQFFDNVKEPENAKALVVTVGKDVNANFSLSKDSKITGVVKQGSSAAIQGAEVKVFDSTANTLINSEFTDSDGKFTINVTNGDYRIWVNAPIGSDFVDEFYNDVADFKSATVVSVAASATLTLSDIILTTGRGIIKGGVTGVVGSATVALGGIKLNVINATTSLPVISGFTDLNGSYTVSIAPGTYTVYTSSRGTTTAFIDEFFDNVITAGSSTAINISSGSNVTADFTLSVGSHIKGVVRSSGTNPLTLAGVEVFALDSTLKRQVGRGVTDGQGNYAIRVPNGTYRVWAKPSNGVTSQGSTFISQFFSNTESFNKGVDVTVTDADKTGVDFNLSTK